MATDPGILPDFQIAKLGQTGVIDPFDEAQVQPASYDVRLGPGLLVPRGRDMQVLDLAKSLNPPMDTVILEPNVSVLRGQPSDGAFALAPQRFVLGATRESLRLPNDLAARIEGKSSLAKAGLQIHSAGLVAPGYRGNLTLEIANVGESVILLRPDVLVAQIIFERLASACRMPYAGRYQDSQGPQGYREPL